jgi:hypothetical protein
MAPARACAPGSACDLLPRAVRLGLPAGLLAVATGWLVGRLGLATAAATALRYSPTASVIDQLLLSVAVAFGFLLLLRLPRIPLPWLAAGVVAVGWAVAGAGDVTRLAAWVVLGLGLLVPTMRLDRRSGRSPAAVSMAAAAEAQGLAVLPAQDRLRVR